MYSCYRIIISARLGSELVWLVYKWISHADFLVKFKKYKYMSICIKVHENVFNVYVSMWLFGYMIVRIK